MDLGCARLVEKEMESNKTSGSTLRASILRVPHILASFAQRISGQRMLCKSMYPGITRTKNFEMFYILSTMFILSFLPNDMKYIFRTRNSLQNHISQKHTTNQANKKRSQTDPEFLDVIC